MVIRRFVPGAGYEIPTPDMPTDHDRPEERGTNVSNREYFYVR